MDSHRVLWWTGLHQNFEILCLLVAFLRLLASIVSLLASIVSLLASIPHIPPPLYRMVVDFAIGESLKIIQVGLSANIRIIQIDDVSFNPAT